MIDIFKVIKFIKDQWLAGILIICWVLWLFFSTVQEKQLQSEVKTLHDTIKKETIKIDTLYKHNESIVTKIKLIKQKEHDTIKIIDTMSNSELQKFFADRYNKKDSIKG